MRFLHLALYFTRKMEVFYFRVTVYNLSPNSGVMQTCIQTFQKLKPKKKMFMFMLMGVRPCLWIASTSGPVIHPPNDIVSMESHSGIFDGKTEDLREKPVPVPLCPPQIPHGLAWVWTWASGVRGWWLTVRAMAQPKKMFNWHMNETCTFKTVEIRNIRMTPLQIKK
jgi:hypothetical protein